MIDEVKIGSNLQHLMKLHGGISVSELARQTRIPQPTLHHILDGTTKKPRKEALEALSNFFSVSIPQLMGFLPLAPVIPNVIKESLKITTVPLISWEALKRWPEIKVKSEQDILLERKVDTNAFALKMKDSSMEPLFPEQSLLIFDPGKKPKHREFVIVHFSQTDNIIFNRLFIDGYELFIKQDLGDGNAKLLKIKSGIDRMIAALIEVRLLF